MKIPADPCRAFDFSNLGDQLFKKGDFAAALANYDQALKIEPGWPIIWLHRADAKLCLRDFEGAEADCTETIRLEPDILKAHWLRAQIRFALKRYEEAEADFSESLRMDPSCADAWLGLALVHMEAKRFREVTNACSKAIECSSSTVEAWIVRGKAQLALAEARDLRLADQDLSQALLLDSSNGKVWAYRADVRLRQGQWHMAILDAQAALKLEPTLSTARAVLARARLCGEEFQACVADCQLALDLEPHHTTALGTLAEAQLRLGDARKCWRTCNRALTAFQIKAGVSFTEPLPEPPAEESKTLELVDPALLEGEIEDMTLDQNDKENVDPTDAEGTPLGTEDEETLYLGPASTDWAPFVQPGHEESILGSAGLTPVETIDLAAAVATRSRARLLLEDLTGTIADSAWALRLNPNLPNTWQTLGAAKLRLGDVPASSADCTQALVLDPCCAHAYATRGKAKLRQGLLQFVITDCSEALMLDLSIATAWSTRAAARLDSGDIHGALSDAVSALQLDPTLVEAWCTEGGACFQLADLERAQAACTKALQLDSSAYAAWFNRANARYEAGKLLPAEADLTMAIKLKPLDPQAWAHRGEIRLARAKDSSLSKESMAKAVHGADDDLKIAVELDPTLTAAHTARTTASFMLQDLQGSVADSSEGPKLLPEIAKDLAVFTGVLRQSSSVHARRSGWPSCKASDPRPASKKAAAAAIERAKRSSSKEREPKGNA